MTDPSDTEQRWWEKLREGQRVPLACLKIDRVGSTDEAAALPADVLAERYRRYTEGVESIARSHQAAWPLHWQGDGVMLFFTDVSGPAPVLAPAQAFRAAKALWRRIAIEISQTARVAVHAGFVPWDPDTGKLQGDCLNRCGHLEADTPPNGVCLTEEVYLMLSPEEQRECAPLGATRRDGIPAYVYPAALAAKADPAGFHQCSDQELWAAFRRYALSSEIRLLRYVGFRLTRKQPPALDIRDVFVPSTVQTAERQRLGWPLERRGRRRAEAAEPEPQEQDPDEFPFAPSWIEGGFGREEPLDDVLRRNRSLVVLGDPGSGKTTLLRWLAVTAARGTYGLGVDIRIAERLLPVPVSVGRLADIRRELGNSVPVSECLARYFHARNLGAPAVLGDFLEARLRAGECLVLLDGLDEVHTAEREGIHTWLETFAAQYPGNRWVASSRIVGYRSFALPGGSELALRPFSDEQVQRYVRGFCRAYVAWESNGVDEPETAERTAAQLLDALAAKPKLKSLTRNPFLLSGMALIHRAEGRVPGHRIQFYEMFCRCLCETWGTARRMVAESAGGAPDRLGYEGEALPILGGLAYRMHQDHPAGRAPREYVTGVLASVLQEKRSVPPEEGGRAAEEFLRRAAEGVQIFLERGPDEWGFLHLTFQEFFAAAGLHAEERFAREALKHLFEPRWEEVIRLGVGYMALVQNRPEEARRFVHRVRRYRDKRRPWITDVLRLQVPLAALLAAEAGEALPPAEQREMAEEFAEWVLRGLPWTGMTTRVLNEISLTGFRDTAAEPYLASLDAAEAPIRARAVQALGLLKGEKAGHSLLAALKDEDPGVRRSVAEALGWLKSEAALEALSAALKDEDASVRGSAAQALGELKSERALQPLLDALKDEDFLVERHAMEALGELEGGAALQRFLAALRDPDTEVRRSAAQVLGELRKENAVPPLVDALRDEDRGVRWLAAEALGRLGSAGAVQPLIAALQSGDDTVRWAAGGALGRIGAEAAIQPLLASLGDVDASVRAGAAGALGEMRSGAAIQPLVAALEDPSGFVRWQAAGALGKLRSVAATQPLVAALQDEDADVRFHAAMALADLGSPNALEPLVAALRGSDRDTRWQAAMALGRLKDIEAVEPLTTALQDSDGFVGFIAAEALGRLKGEAAVQPLLAALQTGTDPVRSGAAAALIALSQLPLGPTKRQAVGRRAMRRAAPKRRRRPAGQQDSAARTP